jgi:polysaccharide export outer membrane protein
MIILLFMFASSWSSLASVPTKYLLGAGDQIEILVYQEPDLTTITKINQSGAINLPLVGEVKLEGLTIEEAKRSIEDKLRDGFLVYPDVTLSVKEYRPFFIHGEVERPGSYKYQAEINLEQAIALAGGLKDRASRSQWLIWRGFPQKSFKASKSEKILPGDVIKIDKSFF